MSGDDSNLIKLLVSNIPEDFDEQDLVLHLEGKRIGGGEIIEEEVKFNAQTRTAVIVFRDNEVAKNLLAVKNVVLSTEKGQSVCVTLYENPSPHSMSDESSDDDHDPRSQSRSSFNGQETGNSVFIENVPEEMYDFLDTYIEQQSGGSISTFEPDKLNNGVLVTFEEVEAACKLLAAGHIQFGKTFLKVVCPPPIDDTASRTVLVSGIPELMPTEVLKVCLESPKANGGAIEKISHEAGQDTAVVIFKDVEGRTTNEIEVAERLIEAGKATFKKTVLTISRPPAKNSTRQSEDDCSAREEVIDTVQVSNLPKALLSQDTLEMFFEDNGKSGGGDVASIVLNVQDACACLTFKDPQVAQSLLKEGFVVYKGTKMLITKLENKSAPDNLENDSPESARTVSARTVEVTGIPKGVSEEELLMFLENKRKCGGGSVDQIQFNGTSGTAVVTYADEDVAVNMLKKGRLRFLKYDLQIARPRMTKQVPQSHDFDGAFSAGTKCMSEPKTIEVSGLSKDITEQQLLLYFESPRYSGGTIDEGGITLREHTAFVTFSDPDVARRVASIKHKLQNLELQVALVQTWPETESCAIHVKGLSEKTSTDTVRNFFENERRNGGGPIVDIFREEDTGYITYENRETAKRVVNKKQLQLGTCVLTVEMMKPGHPPPIFIDVDGVGVAEDILLYVDLPAHLEVESLKKYATDAGGVPVSGITFCTKPGVALIKYIAEPEYDRVLLTLCSRPYRGRMLSVKRLPMTKVIQVHNIADLSEQNLLLFFESERNHGGPISYVEFKPDEGCALIEFEDLQVMNNVLRQKHVLEKQELNVSPYFPSLGVLPPGFDSSTPLQAIPPDVPLECHPQLIHFVCQSKPSKEKIHDQLKQNHCFVQWPKARSRKLILKCTVVANHPKAFTLTHGWSERCTNIVQTYFNELLYVEEDILKEIWKPLKAKYESTVRQPTNDEMLMHWEETNGIVFMCGLRGHVEKHRVALKKMKHDFELELEQSRRQISETFNLKPHQIELLRQIDLDSQFGRNQATISLSEKAVVINGQPGDVTEIKLKVLQKVSFIVSSSAGRQSPRFIKFFEKPAVKEHLIESSSRKNYQVTWSFQEEDLIVYGFDQKNVDSAVAWIKSEVVENRIDQKSTSFTNSKKWKDLEASLPKAFKLSDVFVDSTSIVIISVQEQYSEVVAKVSEFVDKNVVIEESVSLKIEYVQVLKLHAEHQIDKIQTNFHQYKVKISFDMHGRIGYRVSATVGGMKKAKDAMTDLVASVKSGEYRVTEKSHVKFLKNPASRNAVLGSVSKHSVVAKFSDEEEHGGKHSPDQKPPCLFSQARLANGKSLQLMIGDIIQCSADVIVNPANSQLRDGGGVSGAIWSAGGREIERECSEYLKKNSELRPGQVFVSTAGTMSFKKVVHTVGPKWKGGTNNEDQQLEDAVTAALKKSDELGFSSVAIPAISCGLYGFPVDKAAKIILRSILDVLKSSKVVKVVYLVSGEDNIRKFHDGLSRLTTTISSPTFDTSEELYETLDNGNTEAEYEMVERPRGGGGRDDSGSKSLRTEEGIDIAVIVGSITAQKTDVVFCTSDKDLALGKGAISKGISQEAGPGLSSECMTKYPKGINYGEVVKAGAYNLKCRQVYLGVCPRWDNGGGRTENILRRLIKSSLEMASTDGMTSIAFPSIGTGNLQIPHDVVAKAMLDETVRFSAACGSKSSVKSVSIILYQKDQQTIDCASGIDPRPKVFYSEQFAEDVANLLEKCEPLHRLYADGMQELKHGKPVDVPVIVAAFDKEVDQMKKKRGPQDSRAPSQPQHSAPRQHMPPTSGRSETAPKLECRVGNVVFTVKFGDITREICDAIVNSTNERLDVTIGALSKAIIQAGGNSIVDECKSLGKLTDGMAVTAAGNLPCKKIFHLFAKPSTKAWKDVIHRCFAEAERLKLTSLAMPPLGTGYAKACSPAEIAEAIFEELSDFSQKNPTSLKQITIIVKQPGMLNEFIAAVEKAEKTGGSSQWNILTKVKEFFQGMFEPPPVEHESHAERRNHPKRHAAPSKPVPAPRIAGSAVLVIHLYSMYGSNIEKAVKEIKQIFEAAVHCKNLNNEKVLNCLASFTAAQEKEINVIEREHDVKIVVDKRNGIRISGDQEGISSAVAAIYDVLFEQKDKELEVRENSRLAKQAEWSYDPGNGKPTMYDTKGAGVLERAYQDKKKKAEWLDANGVQHKVSLHHWHDDTGKGKYSVTRSVPGQISLPLRWDPMLPTETVKLVQLKTDSNEYKEVETQLTATGKVNSIVKIERLQNPRLFKLYMVAKTEMDQKHGTSNNEQFLWHGTAVTNVKNINENNFNRNYGGVHGLSIGNGVYFATKSQYSINGYSTPDASGTKYIYRARVLSGKIGTGQGGIKEPPAGSDSVGNSEMVVVFYDAQAYPEYLITFK